MFAIDTTSLPRPDATYADARTMVQVRRKGGDAFLPGWAYSILVAISWGHSSWVDPVEARRLLPTADHTEVTLTQIRDLLTDLAATGAQAEDAPPPLVLLDAGNDATAIAHELHGEHVQLLVRLGSKRVFYTDPDPRPPGKRGAPRRHGQKLSLSNPADSPAPHSEWVSVERLPGGRKPAKDLWLLHCAPPGSEPDLDLLWKAYLRRFDQEHFHRFARVYLGLGAAHLASAVATDRWVQLALAAYAQLRIASPLAHELRRPWHPKPAPGAISSPYQTRLGFRRLRARLGSPADSPKFSRPGPGRPKGSKNRPKAPCPPRRKTTKTDTT
jgi:hypothetical protein